MILAPAPSTTQEKLFTRECKESAKRQFQAEPRQGSMCQIFGQCCGTKCGAQSNFLAKCQLRWDNHDEFTGETSCRCNF